MTNERILIGTVSAALCLLGLWRQRWFLHETAKGQRLIAWFGEERALWVLRLLLTLGIVFGTLLAIGVIRPLEW
jgi:hypothetical protein